MCVSGFCPQDVAELQCQVSTSRSFGLDCFVSWADQMPWGLEGEEVSSPCFRNSPRFIPCKDLAMLDQTLTYDDMRWYVIQIESHCFSRVCWAPRAVEDVEAAPETLPSCAWELRLHLERARASRRNPAIACPGPQTVGPMDSGSELKFWIWPIGIMYKGSLTAT